MTYAFTQDVPIGADTYDQIRQGLGSDRPPGLIVHLAAERPEGGLRYTEVWESEAHAQQFVDERLHPVVHAMLRPIFGDELPPEPERVPLNVIHAWVPGG